LTRLHVWYIITMLFIQEIQGLHAISPSFYEKSETPGGVERITVGEEETNKCLQLIS
jgi:hypothetical protein